MNLNHLQLLLDNVNLNYFVSALAANRICYEGVLDRDIIRLSNIVVQDTLFFSF